MSYCWSHQKRTEHPHNRSITTKQKKKQTHLTQTPSPPGGPSLPHLCKHTLPLVTSHDPARYPKDRVQSKSENIRDLLWQGQLLSCHDYHAQMSRKARHTTSCNFFLLFFSIFPSFFLSTKSVLCEQNQDINKDQLLGRKAFLQNKDSYMLRCQYTARSRKENIYKIQVFFSIFVFFLQC